MSRKGKGINAERDIVHMFWATNKWGAHRIAGSGSSRYPSADIVASNKIRRLAIECKTCKENKIYLKTEDVSQLRKFSSIFGAEPWIAARFNNKEWFFLTLEDLEETCNSFIVSRDLGERKGLLFEELISD